MNQRRLKHVDALVLCGGLGARLRSTVPNLPKPLARVNGRAFLDIFLDRLFQGGIGRAILCVGYRKEQIIKHIKEEAPRHPSWGEIIFSEEDMPLGTGGAVKNAEAKIRGDQFFVLNGDTLAEVPLLELRDFHHEKGSMVTIAAAPVPDRSDVGSIDIHASGRITGFRERATERAGFVSAGIYLMEKTALHSMPDGAFSLEQDFFPKITAEYPCFAFITAGDVLDIGTPERYNRANQ